MPPMPAQPVSVGGQNDQMSVSSQCLAALWRRFDAEQLTPQSAAA